MKKLFFILLTFFVGISYAQTDSTPQIDTADFVQFFKVDKLEDVEELDFQVEEEEVPVEFKEKRKKKRVYYGHKTKRAFTKKGQGNRQEIEIFHYLKVWQEPSKYVKDIYWFDTRKMKVVKSKKFDPKFSKILHGPYKKLIDGVIVEEGIYYIGTKHGRWVTMKKPKDYKFREGDKDKKTKNEFGEETIIEGSDTVINYQLLQSKEKYNRGWPKYSKLNYYDANKEELKEVLPYDEHHKMNGEYFLYFKNGKIKLRGFMINGIRVGIWTEYKNQKHRTRRLQQFEYPAYPIGTEEATGVLIMVWDDDREVIYDKAENIDKRKK